MFNRREVLLGGGTALAMPFVQIKRARAQAVRTRRDVTTLAPNDPVLAQYAEAVKKMHELPQDDPRSWRSQALIHINHCAHGTAGFTAWHRVYLANFEAICAELVGDPTFALPYWNWSNNNGRLPAAFFGASNLDVHFWNDPSNASSPNWANGAQVQSVPVSAMRPDFGLLDSPRGGVFTAERIENIRRLSDFTLFWRSLEGSPHNTTHVIVGDAGPGPEGHMLNGVSPLDPCFWLHHCNVDRIWAEWQAAGNTMPTFNDIYSGQFVDGTGAAKDFVAQEYVDHVSKGFTYDTLDAADPLTPFIDAGAIDDMVAAFAVRGDKVVGASAFSETVMPEIETRLPVAVDGLAEELFSTRIFRPTSSFSKQRFAVEERRILARIHGVKTGPGADRLVAGVFVNCPYLSPVTPYTDPHYCGSFSFFGNHGGHAEHDGREFLIDVSSALRDQAQDGRLDIGKVDVQVMALPSAGAVSEATFTVGGVELLSV